MNLLARFIGIITSPKATFQSVVAHPAWFGMLALIIGLTLACTVSPLFTEWGRRAAVDLQVQQMESFGMTVTDDQYRRIQEGQRLGALFTAIGILVVSPVMTLIVSGILYAVFNAAMGGNATFKQLFAVVVHAGVITALAQLFALPLNWVRGSMTSTTNIAVLFPMLPEGSFIANLLGTVDLFMIWYVIVGAIGLGVLYRRRTQNIAIGLFAVYAVIGLAIAIVKSSFGGN